MISKASIDLIIACEVSSQTYYEAHYRRPEWPGGASGITIGIGYDIGYSDQTKLRADWSERVSETMLRVMEKCLGVRGTDAKDLLPSIRSLIDIPWEQANAVFINRDVPDWTAQVCAAIPGAEKLPADCLGALVSLAYNRGCSFKSPGDRYAEMRAIRAHVMAGQLDKVPDDFRSMKRLWPTVKGLRDRRDAEAKLFAQGASLSATLPPLPSPPDVEPVDKPPSQTAGTKHAVAATAIAGGTAAAINSHSMTMIAVFVVAGIAIAAAVYFLWPKKGN
jgi:GH24 family phage-related lysozyme (muramidase)